MESRYLLIGGCTGVRVGQKTVPAVGRLGERAVGLE